MYARPTGESVSTTHVAGTEYLGAGTEPDAAVSRVAHRGICLRRPPFWSVMVTSVQRTRQLAAIEAAYASASAGEGRLVLISGEPGAGKTTLVAQLQESIANEELLVGYCDPLSTPRWRQFRAGRYRR